MTNRYPGRCETCKACVAAWPGTALRGASDWAVRCATHARATPEHAELLERLVDLDVAQWGECERGNSRRRYAGYSVGALQIEIAQRWHLW